MRLIKWWLAFKHDKNAFVLSFTALTLPLILLIGVLVLQSGQLFIRQAELEFLTRQTAQSGVLKLAETLRAKATENYTQQCDILEPPLICNSDTWSNFISVVEIENVTESPFLQQSLRTNLLDFLQVADPQKLILNPDFSYELTVQSGSLQRVNLKLFLNEPQDNWLGNVLRTRDYQIETQALAYLNF
jgi:hypothetical protein